MAGPRRSTKGMDLGGWADAVLVRALLLPVYELRERVAREGLTPELETRLRAVRLAALGARVPPREAEQALLVSIIEGCLPEARRLGTAEAVERMKAKLAVAIGEKHAARIEALPVDSATIALLRSRCEAIAVAAWVMVRCGMLVDHEPMEPEEPKFAETVERARHKVKNALTKTRGS